MVTTRLLFDTAKRPKKPSPVHSLSCGHFFHSSKRRERRLRRSNGESESSRQLAEFLRLMKPQIIWDVPVQFSLLRTNFRAKRRLSAWRGKYPVRFLLAREHLFLEISLAPFPGLSVAENFVVEEFQKQLAQRTSTFSS